MKKDVVEWLDSKIAAVTILQKDLDVEINGIQLCSQVSRGLHVYEGIDRLANAVECQLHLELSSASSTDVYLYFMYKGVKIYQLESIDTLSAIVSPEEAIDTLADNGVSLCGICTQRNSCINTSSGVCPPGIVAFNKKLVDYRALYSELAQISDYWD